MTYTPTTEEVQDAFEDYRAWHTHKPGCVCPTEESSDAEFDRWLAEVIRKAKEEAWDEGWVSETFVWNPYRQEEK